MTNGGAKSPWNGVLVGICAIAVVSVYGIARDWDFDSWIRAVVMCAVTGAVFAVAQAVRNRRIDRMVEQARAMDARSEAGPAPR